MARQPLYTAQPDTEIPFALRLAQFLLGASDSLGQYNQTLAQQSRIAGDQIEQEERSLDRKSALSLRDKQIQMLDEDRDLARYDRLTAAAEKQAAQQAAAREKAATQEGLFRLSQLAPKMQEAPPEPAYANDPERLQPNLLRALVKQPRTMPEIVKDAGLTPEMVGHKDVYSSLGEFFKSQKLEAPKVQALSKGAKLVDESTGRTVAENSEPEKPAAPFYQNKSATELEIIIADPSTPPEQKVIARTALKGIQQRETDKFAAQGKATGEAMANREGIKYDTVALGDEAGKWVGPGGKPVNPGLSRKEAVAMGGRPLAGVDEAKSLRAAAGLGRYLRQYLPLLSLYPEAGSSDAVNLVRSGIEGGKLWLARKSGGAPTRIEALEGQITKLIRAWGDTANAAVQERAATLKGVPGFVETKQSATEKLLIILDQAIGSFEDLGVEPPKDLIDLQQQLEGGGGGAAPPPGFTPIH